MIKPVPNAKQDIDVMESAIPRRYTPIAITVP
jgi:hypothetical protein